MVRVPSALISLMGPAQGPISAPGAISPCPSSAAAGLISRSPQLRPARPWVPLSQAHPHAKSLTVACPCPQGGAQCLGCPGCPPSGSVVGRAQAARPCPAAPGGAPMALGAWPWGSPRPTQLPGRCIRERPKRESLFLLHPGPRNEQGRCRFPPPHAGRVGHPGIASCATSPGETCCRNSPATGSARARPE